MKKRVYLEREVAQNNSEVKNVFINYKRFFKGEITKKTVFLLTMVFVANLGFGQIKVNSSGKVGIGMNNPTYSLDLKGTARFSLYSGGWEDIIIDGNNQWGAPQMYCNSQNLVLGTTANPVNNILVNHLFVKVGMTVSSDERLKENIKPIKSSLDKLLLVNGKTYNYIDNSMDMKITPLKEKLRQPTFGFIAQELKEVFPELVNEPNELYEYYSIDYIAMIPILVEAIKEQQNTIENMRQKIEELSICCSTNKTEATEKSYQQFNLTDTNSEEIKVYQNAPNPFNATTTIQCYIPQIVQKAELCVYNMQGVQVKCFFVSERGNIDVQIQAGNLAAGIYTYILIGDSKTSEAKQMILTK